MTTPLQLLLVDGLPDDGDPPSGGGCGSHNNSLKLCSALLCLRLLALLLAGCLASGMGWGPEAIVLLIRATRQPAHQTDYTLAHKHHGSVWWCEGMTAAMVPLLLNRIGTESPPATAT